LNAASARVNDADCLSMLDVAALVSPSASVSSSGMRTAAVVERVEKVSSASSQSSPLACVTTANDVTSTEVGAPSDVRSSCKVSHVAPGSM